MDNIIEYIRTYGQNTFAQKPFNEVDSLVICQLSYMNFQHIKEKNSKAKENTRQCRILYRLQSVLSVTKMKGENKNG